MRKKKKGQLVEPAALAIILLVIVIAIGIAIYIYLHRSGGGALQKILDFLKFGS